MSLNVSQLEKVRELASGVVQARCPACAEGGHDRAGEHLRIYPDGRFGCCVHPKDREHRKRIFALVGDRSPRTFTVRVDSSKPTAVAGVSVKAALHDYARTLRTGISDSVSSQAEGEIDIRTLRTPFSNPYAYREKNEIDGAYTHTCKDQEKAVLSVLSCESVEPSPKLPFFTPCGTLSIPFGCPERYHWWNGGQSIAETRAELLAQTHEDSGKENDATAF